MKRHHLAFTALVTAALASALMISPVFQRAHAQGAGSAPAASLPTDGLGALIQAILSAPDPSSAIAAYGHAQAAAPNDVAIEDTYLRKMVDLNVPEMADTQARDLIQRQPNNSMAWAVVAYMNARRGQTTDALSAIITATQRLSDEPFVMRTAGQLLAWYDTDADQSQIPDSIKQSLAEMRKQLSQRPEFAAAYQKAIDVYRSAAAPNPPVDSSGYAATPAPAPPAGPTVYEPPAPISTYGSYAPPPSYYYADYSYPPVYYQPYPYISAVIIIDGHHHRDHQFHHQDDNCIIRPHGAEGGAGHWAQPHSVIRPGPTAAGSGGAGGAGGAWSVGDSAAVVRTRADSTAARTLAAPRSVEQPRGDLRMPLSPSIAVTTPRVVEAAASERPARVTPLPRGPAVRTEAMPRVAAQARPDVRMALSPSIAARMQPSVQASPSASRR